MPNLDYDGYNKSLEKILEGVAKDYWASYVDINRHQVNVAKTYLWVSAALIGIYAAAYEKFDTLLLDHSCLLIFSLISFVLASLAFGICLYAIPARKGYKAIPNKGWGEFSGEAYQYLKNGSDQVYSTFLTSHISKIDHAFAHNFKTNQSRDSLLRFTSWLLILSFLFAVFVASAISIEAAVITNHTIEEKNMSEDNEQDNAPEPTLQVPEPPPPADIGGGSISTHSADSTEGTTFSTESFEEK